MGSSFILKELLFKKLLMVFGILMILILAGIVASLIYGAFPAIQKFGLGFITESEWDPVFEKFGALPFIAGTLITSFLALAICIPFALFIAIFLGEYARKSKFSGIIRTMTELLAGIPSVIYGFWALFFLVPLIRGLEMKLHIMPYGVGILSASLVLSIMIIPYAASLSREVIELVPNELKEAAYSLGATRAEVIGKIVLPYSFSGIFAGVILSLGRALGETMAVTMIIGNSNIIPKDIFSPANTMASVIANEFSEATNIIHTASLIKIGLVLLIISAIINVIGKYIIKKFSHET